MPRRANVRPDEHGREKILEAGLELFGERGFEASSIAEIGRRAGITKSVMYHYFGSKAGLYEAVLEAQTQDLLDAVSASVPEDPGAPRLRRGIDTYLEFFEARPAAWRLLLREAPVDRELSALYEKLAQRRADGLSRLLTSDAKRRQSSLHVSVVMAGIRAFTAWWHDHPKVPRKRVVDAIMEFASAGRQLP
jgi:AcrR family transcriptional regulator